MFIHDVSQPPVNMDFVVYYESAEHHELMFSMSNGATVMWKYRSREQQYRALCLVDEIMRSRARLIEIDSSKAD